MKAFISRSHSEPLSVGDTLFSSESSDIDTCFLYPLDLLHTDRLHDIQGYEVDAEDCTVSGGLWVEAPSRLTIVRKLSMLGLAACATAQAFECKDVHILEDSIQPSGIGQGVIQALQHYKGHVKTEGTKSVACATGEGAGTISTGRESVACATGGSAAVVGRGLSSAAIATGPHSAALAVGNRTLAGTSEAYSVAVAQGAHSAAIASGFRSVAEADYEGSAAVVTGRGSLAQAEGRMSVSVAVGDKSVACAKDDKAIAIATGYDSQAKGALGSWLILVERDTHTCDILSVASVQVDGEKVKADVVYTIKNGKVVEKV